ncbi:DUF4345 domain-containing protein [Ectothiorhodospiraceae bacterium WFHF3C12]|nr:DUF4345 domain-containing protein [Ectothiorhodospiraceae bacterium WFHF3C12]
MRINLPKHAKGFLLLVGAIFAAVGLLGLYSPVDVVSPVGLQATSVGAKNEVRAAFGGVYFLFGLYFLWSAFQAVSRRGALTAAILFLGGLAGGRILSLFVDGITVNPWIWAFGVLEVVLLAVGLLIAYNERAGRA